MNSRIFSLIVTNIRTKFVKPLFRFTNQWHFFSLHSASDNMDGVLMPRESGRFIAETSKDVKIKDAGIQAIAELMYQKAKTDTYSIKSWKEDHELNPQTATKQSVNWVFVADTLNFSFFSDDESKKFTVNYKGKDYTGYWSWIAAFNKALDKGINLTDPNVYASITKEELKDILKSDSDVDIPLLDERVDVLQEAGKVLLKKYDGSFVNCIKKCEKSAQTLLKLVVNDFPSYRDTAEYNGKTVAIYKRAQILIADIWGCFEGQGYGEFNDIDSITMFADYRIPQALLYFDALEYSKELKEYLDSGKRMKTGDRYEVEIRGCSIWATELVCEETKKLLQKDEDCKDKMMNSILIDHFLWDFRREQMETDKMKAIPFHKIRCIYY